MKNLPKASKKTIRSSVVQKPPVPSCDDKPIMGLRTSKNYIISNATQAIIQAPKVMKEEESFIKKKTYGKIPEYLNKVKQDIQLEKELVERCIREQEMKGMEEGEEVEYEVMDEGERQDLINSLKKKWDKLNSTYQKICHKNVDSLGDIKRKEEQETQLQQLEDDIQRLCRPGPLLIQK